ncbi:MAG TPA: tRNA lysidine(34) synthetase TilS [Steroidobacteraceae bacterium]|nr:tRNA lysidine(34) synthetase TilS [Steroidobacteraceae bacterium]
MEPCAAALAALLERQLPPRTTAVVVAVSGGTDSACLLAAAACLAGAGRTVRAVHVDHGLQPAAADFRRVCAELCARLGVPLSIVAVPVRAARGASLEAVAREARYAALGAQLAAGECLLTAHHAEDQAETVLLQALRGAGPAGLAGMPRVRPLGRGSHLRPLLERSRGDLARCAAALGLATIADPMNCDPRFDRVHLRLCVWPAIEDRWPGAAGALGRAARYAGEALEVLNAVADADLASLRDGEALSIARLRPLAHARRGNALRRWIGERALPPPSARLAEALRQCLEARADHLPVVAWGEHALRRYRGRIHLTAAAPPRIAGTLHWEPRAQPTLELGAGLGRLRWVERTGGFDAARLPPLLSVTARRGGESLKPAPRAATRSVQHLCQADGILPWMRGALPFVHADGRLIAVGDLWADARDRVPPAGTGAGIAWEGAPTLV